MSSYSRSRTWRLSWLGFFLGAAFLPALMAADRGTKDAAADPNAKTVDVFDGIRNGDIVVRFVPKDSREARITVENKTDKPLSVKLPDAFAGVPVLAQAGNAGGNRGGGAQPAGGGGGMGGGMMYVPPEKAESVKVPTVCLEHGKAEPRPSIPYEIKPIESVTDKPAVWELCRMVGARQVSQRVAQAATWHLNNNMSWDQLAAKQARQLGGGSLPYFSPQELRAAMQVADVAVQTAHERQQQKQKSSSSSSASGN